MNRIFGIFVTFLLIPSLPTFGAMDEYEKCELNAGMKAFREWGFSEIPAEYQDKIDKIINSPVEQESSGTCTPGGNYHCNKGDIFKDCCPCAQFDAEMQVEEIFRQDYIKKECGYIKKQNLQETQATNNHPDNNFDFAATSATQNASSGLLLATPAQEDEPQPNQRQQAVEANLKKATTVPAKPTKNKIDQSPNEQARLTRTALTKFCQDDGFVYKNNGTEIASLGYVKDLCDSKNKVELSCYNFKGDPIPSEDIIRHFANYCYTNTTNSCESKKESRPSDHYNKKDAERAAKQEENKVGKRCEIENATSAKYVKKMSGKIVCEPDDCICGYEIVENNFQYSCKKWRQDKPSCYGHESMPDNATKAHYECNKNNKKICVVDECNYKTHYLDSDKNKCIAKSTVKCTNDEKVNNVGQCQKNPTVLAQPNDPSKQEMSQSDIERDNCVRNQDKKHTKYENGKCVCENNDYEMQDDGVCTLKRAKCKEQSHTKYENGRCVCESDKYEMHSDNNCYMTSAALDAEASEMEDADNAAKDEQLFLETRKEACAIDNMGEWNDKTHKCKCKSGYKLGDDYACHATNKTATNEENKKLCEKDGAGKWTDKNKCECTDPTHSFVDGKGCEKDDKKADEEKLKKTCEELGTKGKWNKTLEQCNCNEKNHIFDEETGCTAATPKFIEAQKEIEKLKSQLEATITELNK